MKKYSFVFSALVVIALSLTAVSCNSDYTLDEEQQLQKARVTATKYYPGDKMTAYNIEYPSRDPFGNPVTLSGAITVGDEIKDGAARELFPFWLLDKETPKNEALQEWYKELFGKAA